MRHLGILPATTRRDNPRPRAVSALPPPDPRGAALDQMAIVRLDDLAERIAIIRRAIRETIAISGGPV